MAQNLRWQQSGHDSDIELRKHCRQTQTELSGVPASGSQRRAHATMAQRNDELHALVSKPRSVAASTDTPTANSMAKAMKITTTRHQR